MERTSSQKKEQTVSMETIESVILSHRSLVSTWIEKSNQIAKESDGTKPTKTAPVTLKDATKHNKYAEQECHQRTYSRLGIGAKPNITSDSRQMQNLRERIMKQNSSHITASRSEKNHAVNERLDEMESRDKAVGQRKKRRL